MQVTIDWTELHPGDRRWDARHCLYAYLDPRSRHLLYLGKAYSSTIRSRLYGPHKDAVFARFFGPADDDVPREDCVVVLHGRASAKDGRRVTKLVLADLESLLIARLKPRLNRTSLVTRISRPEMVVDCTGDWCFSLRFRDERLPASTRAARPEPSIWEMRLDQISRSRSRPERRALKLARLRREYVGAGCGGWINNDAGAQARTVGRQATRLEIIWPVAARSIERRIDRDKEFQDLLFRLGFMSVELTDGSAYRVRWCR
jgi:hypothetical protein